MKFQLQTVRWLEFNNFEYFSPGLFCGNTLEDLKYHSEALWGYRLRFLYEP